MPLSAVTKLVLGSQPRRRGRPSRQKPGSARECAGAQCGGTKAWPTGLTTNPVIQTSTALHYPSPCIRAGGAAQTMPGPVAVVPAVPVVVWWTPVPLCSGAPSATALVPWWLPAAGHHNPPQILARGRSPLLLNSDSASGGPSLQRPCLQRPLTDKAGATQSLTRE